MANRMSSVRKRKLKLRLLKENNYKCFYCSVKCFMADHKNGTSRNAATIEHIYPQSDIRRLLVGNSVKYLTIACYKCNVAKGIKDGYVFRGYGLHHTLLSDLFKGDYSKITI